MPLLPLRPRCSYTVDHWRILERICQFSANSNCEHRCYVVHHSYFDCCTNNRCHSIDYTRHYSADSHHDADSWTVERNRRSECCIVERSRRFDSCIERHCFFVRRRCQSFT